MKLPPWPCEVWSWCSDLLGSSATGGEEAASTLGGSLRSTTTAAHVAPGCMKVRRPAESSPDYPEACTSHGRGVLSVQAAAPEPPQGLRKGLVRAKQLPQRLPTHHQAH